MRKAAPLPLRQHEHPDAQDLAAPTFDASGYLVRPAGRDDLPPHVFGYRARNGARDFSIFHVPYRLTRPPFMKSRGAGWVTANAVTGSNGKQARQVHGRRQRRLAASEFELLYRRGTLIDVHHPGRIACLGIDRW